MRPVDSVLLHSHCFCMVLSLKDAIHARALACEIFVWSSQFNGCIVNRHKF